MDAITARKLFARAIEYEVRRLAIAIAKAPDADINANMPEIVELRKLIDYPGLNEMAKGEGDR